MKTLLLAIAFLGLTATTFAASQVSNTIISTTGVIASGVYSAGSSTSIDFSNANTIYTTAACGAFTLSNVVDGGSYMLVAKGSGTGPATFSHSGLTVHTNGTYTCTSAKHTIFSISRAGSDVYVGMSTGY